MSVAGPFARSLRAAMAGIVLAGGVLGAFGASVEERIAELERQIEALRSEIAASRGSAPGGSAELAEVERKIEILAEEIEKLRTGEAVPDADRPQYGLGPAASKVYRVRRGVSLGGYGDVVYEHVDRLDDAGRPSGLESRFDFLRAVLYVGYKFDDRFVLNSEVEFEHGSTEAGGSVSIEFGALDFLWRRGLNVRAGMLLVPVGLINELHEPTSYPGALRPEVEQAIIPATWSENGAGVFGDLGPFTYRTFVITGLDASEFSAEGIREGRQGGANAKAEDFAWVGRVDFVGRPGLLAGLSVYTGRAGQGLTTPAGERIGARTTLAEGHVDWKWRGLQIRALAATTRLDQAEELNAALGLTGSDSVGSRMDGAYVETGYDVLSPIHAVKQTLIPFVRWETLDTQKEVPAGFLRDPANDVHVTTWGIAYKPIGAIVVKADYQDYRNAAGTATDRFHVSLGWIF